MRAYFLGAFALPAPGQASFDRSAGSIADMFDFTKPFYRRLFLDPSNGTVVKYSP